MPNKPRNNAYAPEVLSTRSAIPEIGPRFGNTSWNLRVHYALKPSPQLLQFLPRSALDSAICGKVSWHTHRKSLLMRSTVPCAEDEGNK